jgi:hypothetical protein
MTVSKEKISISEKKMKGSREKLIKRYQIKNEMETMPQLK